MSFKNIKKIACGDFFQLPPISGKPGFLTSNNVARLLTPFRQSDTSGIYLLANDIINEVQLSLFAITDNYHDPVYGSVPAYSAGQINYDTVLKFIDLKFNPNTQLATDQSGISYYTNTTNAIHIQLSESNTITSIMYNSASADTQVEFLTTTNYQNIKSKIEK